MPAPSPGLNGTQLVSISCSSPTRCTAVGSFRGRDWRWTPFVMRTVDGATWTRIPTPSPGTSDAELRAVDCSSATACNAVGNYSVPGAGLPLVFRTTNGTTWRHLAMPTRFGTFWLGGVSCVSATDCTGIGPSSIPGKVGPGVLRTRNGTHWYRPGGQMPPLTTGYGELHAIDCATATTCFAVGYQHANPGLDGFVARTTDGRGWTHVPIPRASRYVVLADVSCSSPTICAAVGHSIYPPPGGIERAYIVHTTDGLTWRRAPTPTETAPVSLTSIDCASDTDCTAVGIRHRDDFVSEPVILRTSNGRTWVAAGPTPARTDYLLQDVSCAVATRCVVVGLHSTNGSGWPNASLVLRES